MITMSTDPLSNPGSSRVFFCIITGRKNPKAIADFLGIKPPPVIEQLRRLRKIGVIQLGGKEGKIQNYEVNWNIFLSLFIKRAMQKRKRKNVLEEESHEDIEKIKTLAKNKYFKHLILLYLQNIAESKPSNWGTINDAINNFENALRQTASFKRNRHFKDAERQDFFNKMRVWYNRTLSAQTWMDLCLHDAIYKTLKEQ